MNKTIQVVPSWTNKIAPWHLASQPLPACAMAAEQLHSCPVQPWHQLTNLFQTLRGWSMHGQGSILSGSLNIYPQTPISGMFLQPPGNTSYKIQCFTQFLVR